MPLYRIKVDKPNRNGMFKVTRPFCFPYKKRTAGVVPHNKKAKGLDSAFKDKHTMHLMGTGAGLVT